MTVQVQDPIIEYTANGTATVFTFPFHVLIYDDLNVYKDGVQVTTGFTVDDIDVSTGGYVTFTIPPVNGVIVRLQRRGDINRNVDYLEGGYIIANTVDFDIDRTVHLIQDLSRLAIKETADGTYSLDNKRMEDALDPVNAQDMATKAYVDSEIVATVLTLTASDINVLDTANNFVASNVEDVLAELFANATAPAHIADSTIHFTMGEIAITESQISDLQSYALATHNHDNDYEPLISKATAFNKNFGTSAGTVCAGDDARLSDSRIPLTHSHTHGELLDLSNYSEIDHTHVEADITDLQNYALGSHNHTGVYEPADSQIQAHLSTTANPHSVTASQAGALALDGSGTMTGVIDTDVGTFNSNVVDGASVIGFDFDTTNALVAEGSKLASFKNSGTEKASVSKEGEFNASTSLSIGEPTLLSEIALRRQNGAFGILGKLEIYETFLDGVNSNMTVDPVTGIVNIDNNTVTGFNAGALQLQLSESTGVVVIGFGGTDAYELTAAGFSSLGSGSVSLGTSLRPWGLTYTTSGMATTGNIHNLNFSTGYNDFATATNAFEFNTTSTLTHVDSNLLSLQNNSVEKFSIDKDGVISSAGAANNFGVGGNNFVSFINDGSDYLASGFNFYTSLAPSAKIYIDPLGLAGGGNIFNNIGPLNIENGITVSSTEILPVPAVGGMAMGSSAQQFGDFYSFSGKSFYFGTSKALTGGGTDGTIFGESSKSSWWRGSVMQFDSGIADGATAIGYSFDTTNALSTVGAKLLSLKNNANEKFSIDKDGDITTAGDITCVDLTTTGNTSLGDAATDTIGLFGTTPVVQPSGTGETVGFTQGTGNNINEVSTFTGNIGTTAYTVNDVVKALKQLGALAP